jgi:two-component system sensor kinase FixL
MGAAVDGIFIIDAQDPDFPVIYANQSFQKMTGYSEKRIIGRSYFLLYKRVDAGSRIIKEIKHTIDKGRSFHEEIIGFQKNGKKYFNLFRIAPVRDTGGIVTHYVGIQTDVTLMREKELQIDEQRDELLHVTRVGKLAEFVSSLAHEISQPLMAILSYAQAAKRMLPGSEVKIQEILQYIIDDDHRADGVIQRLRMLLKKSAPEIRHLDINNIIRDTVVLIATDATLRGIFLKLDLSEGLPFVHGDKIQLQQVMLNLISNSFDALEGIQGAREMLISTSRKDAGMIVVEVKDSGCGIIAQNMPKLFTHFFTSKPDGLGMGLSISRSIVEAHGGSLEAKNNPDRGAVFYFTLPVGGKNIL